MLRHSAVLHRQDEPGDEITLTGESWLDYRPLRLRGTICVEKPIAPDKVGVLLNRRHSETDIYLPVTAEQRRLWSAMDGRRSMGELVRGSQPEPARAFLETLWRRDQIVLDASNAAQEGTKDDWNFDLRRAADRPACRPGRRGSIAVMERRRGQDGDHRLCRGHHHKGRP